MRRFYAFHRRECQLAQPPVPAHQESGRGLLPLGKRPRKRSFARLASRGGARSKRLCAVDLVKVEYEGNKFA